MNLIWEIYNNGHAFGYNIFVNFSSKQKYITAAVYVFYES